MKEINPYESPSSILLPPDNIKKSGVIKTTLISFFTAILVLILFWLPGKLIRSFHWHSLEKQGDLDFWNFQALFLLSITDFLISYYWLLFPLLIPIIFVVRYIQNHSKKTWLVFVALSMYLVNLLQTIIQSEQNVYSRIVAASLCLYTLVLGPTVIFSWWFFDRDSAFIKRGNNLITLLLTLALGVLLSEISLWAAWRNYG